MAAGRSPDTTGPFRSVTKSIAKVAELHGKVCRQRLDHAHKTALAPVRDYQVIVHEDLKITSMTARPRPRPDGSGGHEPNGAAAKSGLNESLHDAGWAASCAS